MQYNKHYSTKDKNRVTPQSEPIPGRENDMKMNNAGGFTFTVTPMEQLKRFLILGSEGGTYYSGERTLTVENAKNVAKLIKTDGNEVVKTIVDISTNGRAAKNSPAIFALAMCAGLGDPDTRQAALTAMPYVCRTGTHLFEFAEYVQSFRGWGRSLVKAFANHYENTKLDDLVYEVVKYAQRNGWSHRDLLRLSHPKSNDTLRNNLFNYLVKPESWDNKSTGIERLEAVRELKRTTDVETALKLIRDFNLPREVVPTELLNNIKVWAVLLENMPITATIRNLNKMTAIGLLKPLSKYNQLVIDRITDEDILKKGRVHPITLLNALRVYGKGCGDKGSLTWTPVPQITDALEDGFYKSFKTIEPTNKNLLLALDVSGSMGSGSVAGCNGLTPREAAAVMAMVTARTEKNYHIMGFSTSFIELNISAKDKLETVLKKTDNLPFSGTDCALPMIYALEHKLKVDGFVVYTDNETWAGSIQPVEALRKYRNRINSGAKSAVVAFTATEFTIADPKDSGMMDFVGFDSNAPAALADFIRG